MRVNDGIEGNFIFTTERFRLEYLQDLKKEANQRAQAQAAIVSLLMPTVLLLYDHLSKRETINDFDRVALAASLILMFLSLALALVVLVPVPAKFPNKFAPERIVDSGFAEPSNGAWEVDLQSVREEAKTTATLLARRDIMLRASAVVLGLALASSCLTLVRFIV